MPPKRKSTDAPGPAKKSRAASPSLDEEKDPEITKILNKRWSRVSVTRNADEGFRLDNRDPVKAFTFTCFGRAPWFFPGYEDDEENDLDESDEELEDYEKEEMEEKRKNKEEANPASILKPAAEFPDEKWIFTHAGIRRFSAYTASTTVRDAENFGLQVYNDSYGYGIIELVENMLVDFEEVKADWKKQWAVCEGVAIYMQGDTIMPMIGCECGDEVNELCHAVVDMFLSLLAQLERKDLLKPDSEIKNIGAVMGLFIRFIIDVEGSGIDWEDHEFKIKAYAAKHDITIHGLTGKRYTTPAKEGIELPAATDKDPWGWNKLFGSLRKEKGKHFGGDSTDITSWTPAERKNHAYGRKDPFSAKDLAEIKKGGIIGPA